MRTAPYPSDRAILSPKAFNHLDAHATQSEKVETLIDRAGWSVARQIDARYPRGRILILCGPGNNGRDGVAAARVLARSGWVVRVAFISDATDVPPDLSARGISIVAFDGAEASRADLILDAVFGAGLSRAPDAALFATLRNARVRVAIDLPSGVDGATGQIQGDHLDYDLTVTFVRLKPAHLLEPARSLMGEIVCCDIGITDDIVQRCREDIVWNGPSLWSVPHLAADGHKYTRGVVSVCGGLVMPGATRLAVDGARKSGAGVVRVAAGSGAEYYKSVLPADVIVDADNLNILLGDVRRKVWICGPGLTSEEVQTSLTQLIVGRRQVVADAGALAWAKGHPEKLKGVSVITPHMGEFEGLTGQSVTDPARAARDLASRVEVVVILKGASTVIAAPDGRVSINTHASPKLSTAGSGDTLSGVVATFLAAGMAPFEAACAAVWVHGDAGRRAGAWPVAESFAEYLGDAREWAERRL